MTGLATRREVLSNTFWPFPYGTQYFCRALLFSQNHSNVFIFLNPDFFFKWVRLMFTAGMQVEILKW